MSAINSSRRLQSIQYLLLFLYFWYSPRLAEAQYYADLAGDKYPVDDLFFSSDSCSLALVSFQGIALWELYTAQMRTNLELDTFTNFGSTFGFCHGGDSLLITGRVALQPESDGMTAVSTEIWNCPTKKRLSRWKLPSQGYRIMAVSPKGNFVATVSEEGTQITIRNILTGKADSAFDLLPRSSKQVGRLLFSADGHSLAGRLIGNPTEPDTVVVWDLSHGKQKVGRTIPDHVSYWSFSHDSRSLFFATVPGRIYQWDLQADSLIHCFSRPPRTLTALSVAFSPAGNEVAIGDTGGELSVWGLPQGELLHKMSPAHSITRIAYSPNGDYLAAVLQDERSATVVRLWKRHNRALLFASDNPKRIQGVVESALMPHHETIPSKLAIPHTGESYKQSWQSLGDQNAARAYNSMNRLTALPDSTTQFLRNHLEKCSAISSQRVDQLLVQLDERNYRHRADAQRQLIKLDSQAASHLRKSLQSGSLSVEVRKSVETILNQIDGPITSPDLLRQLRLVEVLEHIGSQEAYELLKALSSGAPSARLTQHARAALRRLEQGGRR